MSNTNLNRAYRMTPKVGDLVQVIDDGRCGAAICTVTDIVSPVVVTPYDDEGSIESWAAVIGVGVLGGIGLALLEGAPLWAFLPVVGVLMLALALSGVMRPTMRPPARDVRPEAVYFHPCNRCVTTTCQGHYR